MKPLALVGITLGACLAVHWLANPLPPTAADAIARSDARSLRVFLARGTPVDACDNWEGESLLELTVLSGDRESAALLLERGADPNHADRLGRTPLHAAAMLNDLPMVRLFLARGADVTEWRDRVWNPCPLSELRRKQGFRKGRC